MAPAVARGAVARPAGRVGLTGGRPALALLTALALGAAAAIGDAGDAAMDGPLRRAWFDFQHRLSPRDRVQAPAVVAAVDERSIAALGQWPWPRDTHARLVDAAMAQGAVAVAFDVLFSEPDRGMPTPAPPACDGAPAAPPAAAPGLRATDAALAAALARSPSVTAVSGSGDGDGATASMVPDFPSPPVFLDRRRGGGGDVAMQAFPRLLANLPVFDGASLGRGAISIRPPVDGMLRQAPLLVRIDGRPYPLLGLEALRVALDAALIEATVDARGAGSLRVAGPELTLTAPLAPGAVVWPHLGRFDPARYVSIADILGCTAPPDALAGRIVLVGVTALGLEDRKRFPIAADALPGVELHLQMIEAMVAGAFLRRPDWAVWAEWLAFTLAAGGVLRLAARRRPARALGALAAAETAIAGAALAAFQGGLLLDAATPAAALAGFSLPTLGAALIEVNLQRRRAEAALAEERLRRARMEGELDAARVIQTSLLPPAPLRLPGHGVALHGFMAPAIAVGGDFFDHFTVGGDRVFFVIGDVSDKGVAASLFMALAKSLWKSVALRDGADLAAIQRAANDEITRDNREDMFFTGLCGVLDPATGRLTLSSAGHDMPFLRAADGAVTQLTGPNGLPMGVMPGADYPVQTLTLARGEALVMFTDGLSEARDPAGALFGLDRVRTLIETAPPQADAAALMAHLVAGLEAFADGAPPADDVTLLVLARAAAP